MDSKQSEKGTQLLHYNPVFFCLTPNGDFEDKVEFWKRYSPTQTGKWRVVATN